VKLPNEHLRAALEHAGLSPDDLAQIVAVDVRTVRRWLSGGTPYPRQRGKVARALDTTEQHLWPHIPAAPAPNSTPPRPADVLTGYASADDLAAPDWKTLMRDATDRIDLLGDTLTGILDTPGVPDLLATKATNGCTIRILLSHPGPQLASMADRPGIEIRILHAPAHQDIHRFDEQLLLTLHLGGENPDRAPILHVRRAAPAGLFDRLTDDYGDLWENGSTVINAEFDLTPDDDEEGVASEPALPARDQAAASRNQSAAPRPRHWPRRPIEPPYHGQP
jgi:lambda repressor-like predicted transcriptional regulator